MIYLFSGTPGSGKSLDMAMNICSDIRFGRPVVANFDINVEAVPGKHRAPFWYVPNNELNPDRLLSISRDWFGSHRFHEGAIRVYIDECQLLFNARAWADADRKNWISFFSQHRKYGYDIFLVAQFDRMVDRQIRSLVEYEIKHRKISAFGFKGWLLSLLLGGNTFIKVRVWYGINEKIGWELFHYRRRYSRIYDTFNLFSDEKNGIKTERPPA